MSQRENTIADVWPSFTDLLGAFVLVIFLVLVFFLIRFRSAENVVHKQAVKLDHRTRQLVKVRDAIKHQRRMLAQERRANVKLLADLSTARAALVKEKGARSHLEKLLDRLKKERQQIEAERARVEAALTKAERARQQCQAKIERYVGVKKKIIKRIFAGLRAGLARAGKEKGVKLDRKGGSILLAANVLFPRGGKDLRQGGKRNLDAIWPAVERAILDPINRPYIAGVVVEGYTSSEGRMSYNWKLSSLRALAAVDHIMRANPKRWSRMRGMVSAAGFGPARFQRDASGKEDRAGSRRIELRILFRDREQLERLARELKGKR